MAPTCRSRLRRRRRPWRRSRRACIRTASRWRGDAGSKGRMKISALRALEVFDSRGMPTLKVSMEVGGALGEFFVPAGASTGKAEARELRDGGERYGGKGVREGAVRVLALGTRLHRAAFASQAEFDALLEEEDLPGNVSLGLSGAFAR